VPTGNFGNVLAAWAARRMGLPIAQLIVGVQPQRHPRALPRRQRHDGARSSPRSRPSHGHPGLVQLRAPAVRAAGPRRRAPAETMRRFRAEGRMPVPDAAWRGGARLFRGFALDDEGRSPRSPLCTRPRLPGRPAHRHRHRRRPRRCRPRTPPSRHGRRHRASGEVPRCGRARHRHPPPLPRALADLYERPERFTACPNDLAAIEAFVRAHARRNAA
jgi:threonine synthase